jgi:hypothetical protein
MVFRAEASMTSAGEGHDATPHIVIIQLRLFHHGAKIQLFPLLYSFIQKLFVYLQAKIYLTGS